MKSRRKAVHFAAIAAILTILLWGLTRESSLPVEREQLAAALGPAVSVGAFPSELNYNFEVTQRAVVSYTLHPTLQAKMSRLIRQYHPDFGAFVALDPKTGKVLTLVSYAHDPEDAKTFGNLAVRASFPAASVFKVVTAAAAIGNHQLSSESKISYNGRNHTLYRRNVFHTKTNKWTRNISLREAFARSVNTVFGKIGLFFVGPEHLREYASRFGFNRPLEFDVPVEISEAPIEDDPWSIVEVSSGFTRKSTLSPLQGAVLAATIANDGIRMKPYLVNALDSLAGEPLYRFLPSKDARIIDSKTSAELRRLMVETTKRGTSRGSFRSFFRNKKTRDVEVGGKTGSLTGLEPRGKYDWFVGYAKRDQEQIAFAALTINKEYWTVRSAYLARRFIEMAVEEWNHSSDTTRPPLRAAQN